MKGIATLAAALLALPAHGASFEGYADGFLWNGGVDTDGFGVRGLFAFAPFFATGLIQVGERGATNVDEVRAGGGLTKEIAPGVQPFAQVELVRFDIENQPDETGLALHGGLIWQAARTLSVITRVGLLDAGDIEGSEFIYGGSWEVAPAFSLILERRESVGIAETRVGGRFSFGFTAHPQRSRR